MPAPIGSTSIVLVSGNRALAGPALAGRALAGRALADPALADPALAGPALAGRALAGREMARWLLPPHALADIALIDELARVQLAAKRMGFEIHVRTADERLRELLDLAGLADVIASTGETSVEVRGQPEGGEEVGIEEETQRRDPVA